MNEDVVGKEEATGVEETVGEEPVREMSEGEYRVGINFNPSKNPTVSEVKELSAKLIDLVLALGNDNRCSAIAVTGYEEAAMWAVKSITKKPKV